MTKIGIQTHGVNHSVMRKDLRGGGIAKRGTGQALKSGGRAGKFGGGRTNLLEELGRVEGERSNPNRRAEISRVHGELNRGYAKGGRIVAGDQPETPLPQKLPKVQRKSGRKFKGPGKPKESPIDQKSRNLRILDQTKPKAYAEGGRVGLKHGGKPWGTGPKPGTAAFVEHHLHKPRKKKVIGGAIKIGKILGKKGVDYIRKNRKAIRKEVYSPEGTKKAQDMIDKLKRKYPDSQMFGPAKKAAGGRIGRAAGGWTKVLPTGPRGGHPGFTKESMYERWGGGEKGKPHSSKEGRIAGGERNMRRQRERMKERLKKWKEDNPPRAKLPSPKWSDMPRRPLEKPKWSDMPRRPLEKPKYQPLKKGGKADKNWIQKAVNPKHKGYCTPMTKKTCTPRRKALARTFKKMGRERKAKG